MRYAATTDRSGARSAIFGTLLEGSIDKGQRHVRPGRGITRRIPVRRR